MTTGKKIRRKSTFDASAGLDLGDDDDYNLEQQGLEEFAQDGYFENLETDYDTDTWH